jgi:hypothetical protein
MCLVIPVKSSAKRFTRSKNTAIVPRKATRNFSHGDPSFDESMFKLKENTTSKNNGFLSTLFGVS